MEGLVSSPGDVLLDSLRVDKATIPEGDLHLLFEERHFFIGGNVGGQGRRMGIGVRTAFPFNEKVFLVYTTKQV